MRRSVISTLLAVGSSVLYTVSAKKIRNTVALHNRSSVGAVPPRTNDPIESTLVALGGATAGVLLAILGVPALLALAPAGRVPRLEEIHIDGWVLAFAIGLGALSGILFGLVPAFHATGRELRDILGQSGRTVTGRRCLSCFGDRAGDRVAQAPA